MLDFSKRNYKLASRNIELEVLEQKRSQELAFRYYIALKREKAYSLQQDFTHIHMMHKLTARIAKTARLDYKLVGW